MEGIVHLRTKETVFLTKPLRKALSRTISMIRPMRMAKKNERKTIMLPKKQ